MPRGLTSASGAWAAFRSTLDGGDANSATIARRQIFLDANGESEGADLSPDEEGRLPELVVDTSALFDPARRLQEPQPPQIGPPDPDVTSPAQPAPPARTQLKIGSFSSEVDSQVAGAVTDFVSNTVSGIGVLMGEGPQGRLRQLANLVPEVEKSDKFGAGVIRGVTQFSLAFIPMLGVTNKVLGGAKIASKALAADVLASPVADFFAFKGTETRMADLVLQQAPSLRNTAFGASLLQYLESDPGDSELEGRWKNVVEGEILNVMLGTVLQPRAVVKDFMAVTKELQKINFLRKYLGNQAGAVGDPKNIRLLQTGQGTTEAQKASLSDTRKIKDPGVRLEEATAAVRRTGTASTEKVEAMVDEFHVPVTELDDMVPGLAHTVEEQAGLVNTMREINGDIIASAKKLIVNPDSPTDAANMTASLDNIINAYTAYVGVSSEAGRTLLGGQTLGRTLDSNGVSRTIEALQRFKRGTPDEQLRLAQFILSTPKKDQNLLLQQVGAEVGTGKGWQEAVASAYITTRFTPLSIVKNNVSNALFSTGLVAERFAAATAAKLPFVQGSNITYGEGRVLAHGMFSSIGTAFRAWADQTFRPGQAIRAMDDLTKFDTDLKTLTAQGIGVEGNMAGGLVNFIGHLFNAIPNQLVAGDMAFKTILHAGELQAQAYRRAVEFAKGVTSQGLTDSKYRDLLQDEYKRLLNDPPDDMVKAANSFASYGTFTDAFVPKDKGGTTGGTIAAGLQEHFNAHPLIKLVVPFFRTPLRITQSAAKRTPGIGLMLSDTQEQIIKNEGDRLAFKLAKQASGAAVGITAAVLVANQWMLGAGPGPKSQKGREIQRSQGFQPSSLVIAKDDEGRPTEAIPFEDIPGPYGIALRSMSDLSETIIRVWDKVTSDDMTVEQQEAFDDYVSGQVAALAGTFDDQLFFRNLTHLMSQTQMGNAKAIKKFIAGMTPAMIPEAAKAFDQNTREANTLKEILMEKIPGLRGDVPEKISFLGERYVAGYGVFDEQVPPGLAGYMHTRINPLAAQGNYNPKWQPIRDFQGEHFDKLSGVKATTAVGGIKLSSAQRSAFMAARAGEDFTFEGVTVEAATSRGRTMPDMLLDVVQSSDPDPLKIATYNKIVSAFSKLARQNLETAYPDLAQAILERKLTGVGGTVQAVVE